MRELTFNEVEKVGGAGSSTIPVLDANFGDSPPSIPGPPPQSGRIPPEVQWRILSGVFFNKSLDEIKGIILSGKAGYGGWPGFTILD